MDPSNTKEPFVWDEMDCAIRVGTAIRNAKGHVLMNIAGQIVCLNLPEATKFLEAVQKAIVRARERQIQYYGNAN